MNKTFAFHLLLSYLLLIGLQTSKAEADDSTEEVTINTDTTEPFTEQQQQVKFCHANNGSNANETFSIFLLP